MRCSTSAACCSVDLIGTKRMVGRVTTSQIASASIGHLKSDHRMDRNHLAGRPGDAANAILAAVGYNFLLLLTRLVAILRALIAATLQLSTATQQSDPVSATPQQA